MMLKQWIRNWLFSSSQPKVSAAELTASPIDSHGGLDENTIRFQVYKAVNGKVIQVMHYKHNPVGPDWKGEIFVVPDGADLMDTIRVALVSKALK